MRKIFLIHILLLIGVNNFAQVNFGWAKSIGSPNADQGNAIVADASGNIYVTGYFWGTTDFDPGPGIYVLSSSSPQDIFVCKLNNLGNLVWARNFAPSGGGAGTSVFVDALGNVYTTGYFGGTADFDPGAGTYTLNASGSSDIFINKLNSAGLFVWTKQLACVGTATCNDIKVDAGSNVLLTGSFNISIDLNPGPSVLTYTTNSSWDDDIFVVKLDPSGNLTWAKTIGGSGPDAGTTIIEKTSGDLLLSGYYRFNADFDPGPSTFTVVANGIDDIFILQLDGSGNFVWAKSMGGPGYDRAHGMTIDASNNIYTTGYFNGTSDFDPSVASFTLSTSGSFTDDDIFVSKLDPNGNFIWAKQMGGPSNSDQGNSITLDALGNVYTTGRYLYTGDFDPGPGTYTMTSVGSAACAFVSILDPSGNFSWAGGWGAAADAWGECITIDNAYNIYTTGPYRGKTDFDPSPSSFTLMPQGGFDIFIHKLGQSSLGIKDISFNHSIGIYPNPNSGEFKLKIEKEIENAELILINSLGQKVYDQRIFKGVNYIRVSGISAGLYNYILLEDDQKFDSGKVIINEN
ncbi:MAG: SBBP repeat-containing protein [Bacteroidia bacterium]|nr:SBBP repeat-containing protein [Bacteroidia bacterium]